MFRVAALLLLLLSCLLAGCNQATDKASVSSSPANSPAPPASAPASPAPTSTSTDQEVQAPSSSLSPAPADVADLELVMSVTAGESDNWFFYQPKEASKFGLTIYHTSDNKGIWIKGTLPAEEIKERYSEETIFTSFTPNHSELSSSTQWIMLTGGPSLGQMLKYLFKSEDNGKTWTYVSDLSVTVKGYVTGIAFPNSQDGWVAASYHGDVFVPLYRTKDGGKHWTLQPIDNPGDYKYGNASAPVFDADHPELGSVAIEFRKDDETATIKFSTRDGGDTWTKAK